jgi:DNA processing protein
MNGVPLTISNKKNSTFKLNTNLFSTNREWSELFLHFCAPFALNSVILTTLKYIMVLEHPIDNTIKKAISPLREIAAYEALWLQSKASFKTLSNLFKNNPGSLPSDLIQEEFYKDLYPLIKELILDEGVNYNTNILINKTWDYPTKLKDAAEPVEILYYAGNLDYLQTKSIAIVGSRNPSDDGLKRTSKITKMLVEDNFTIVSGLAKGVDTRAHETAIAEKGRTIAVIGTPLTKAYPKENIALQNFIALNHLLVSQVPFVRYSKQTPFGNKLFFPERNKTMSALTEATIIIEASDTSGTLIQAKAALQQKRKLFILDSCFQNRNITWPAKFEKLGAIRVCKFSDISDVLNVHNK